MLDAYRKMTFLLEQLPMIAFIASAKTYKPGSGSWRYQDAILLIATTLIVEQNVVATERM